MMPVTLESRTSHQNQRSRPSLRLREEPQEQPILDGTSNEGGKEEGEVSDSGEPSRTTPAHGTVAKEFDDIHPAPAAVQLDLGLDPKAAFMGQLSKPGALQPRPESFEKKYELIRTLKSISQGPIHLVKSRRSPPTPNAEIFIVKQLRTRIRRDESTWPGEAKLLASQMGSEDQTHPNIVKLLGVNVDVWTKPSDPICNLTLEFCSGGDLDNFCEALRDRGERGGAPKQFVAHIAASMIEALSYLHTGEWYNADTGRTIRTLEQSQILHRDIKMANIFLRWDNQSKYGLPTPVLGDFGLATTAKDNVGFCGTRSYWAPEIMKWYDFANLGENYYDLIVRTRKQVHTPATDMYALGVTLIEVITGGKVFVRSRMEAELEHSDCAGDRGISELVKACLDEDPKHRPKANELLEMSNAFKEDLQRGYAEGQRLPASIWPDPFRFEDVSPSPAPAPAE